jgi:arylsulfatase A
MGLKEKTIIQQMTDEEDPHSFGRLSDRDTYEADNIKYIDVAVGRVIETLEKCNLLEDTILVFTSDNGPGVMGEAVGGGLLPDQRHKGGILDAATRVPCIVHWPKGAPAGARCNDLVDFTDFLPTFAEAAGDELSSNASFDGRSFLAQLRGEQGNPRDWIYIHGGSHPNPGWRDLSKRVRYDKPDPWSCRYIRGRRYKLYADGRFYDMLHDIEEERPLKPDTAGQDIEQIREEYKKLLDEFAREAKHMQRRDPVFIYE